MSSKQRLRTLLVLLAIGLLVLAGCTAPAAVTTTSTEAAPAEEAAAEEAAPAEADSSEPVTISFWGGWTGPDADKMKGIVDLYMSEHPNVTIEFETQQWTPLFTKFLADASSGNAPDILALHPVDLGQFAELGLLDGEMASTFGLDESNFSPTAWEGTFFNGVQYAVPIDLHMHGLYYNKDLYEAAGITEPPTTGDELIETAKLLTLDANGNNATSADFDPNNIVQYGLGFHQHHHIAFQLAALLVQQGEIPYTADMTEVQFTPEAATKALQWIQDFVYVHHTTPVGEKTPPDDFIAGNIAMLIDGPWQMPAMEEAGVNFGTARYPKVFDEQVAWGSGHSLSFPVTNASDAEKAAVADFVNWLGENIGQWALSGQIPASNAGREYAATLPNRQAFIDSMDTMYLFPGHPKAAEVFSNAATSPFLVMANALLLDQEDPAVVAQQFIDNMNAVLAQP